MTMFSDSRHRTRTLDHQWTGVAQARTRAELAQKAGSAPPVYSCVRMLANNVC